jgi:DNA-binding transcriptional LysR family regulator
MPGYEALPRSVRAVTLHQLRIFAAVAAEGGFSRAANRLSISEPAVSEQIKLLERALTTRLVNRRPGRRDLSLTEAGELLLETCTQVFEDLENAFRRIELLDRQQHATVCMGVGPNFGSYELPQLYASFHGRHPDITVSVSLHDREELLQGVRRGDLDLAVVVGPLSDGSLISEPLARFDAVLVATPVHRLAGGQAIPFASLASEQLVLAGEASSARKAFELLAQQQHMHIPPSWEMDSPEGRIAAVTSGLGIALVAYYTVAPRVASGEMVVLSVEGLPIRLDWVVVYAASRLAGAAEALKNDLKEQVRQLEPQTLWQAESYG